MTLSFQKQHEPLIQTGIKIHTLRDGERWREGMSIQFYTNMYKEGMHKFHPDAKAISVQDVFMSYFNGSLEISIDDKYQYHNEIEKLILNDGFDSRRDFIKYFFMSRDTWRGQLIHWTDLKY